MDLNPYVESLRQQLAATADAAGDDARALAERLVSPLESALRLLLLDALSTAADEITRDLAPGSVELRLRGREPAFVVTIPQDEPVLAAEPARTPPPEPDEGATARINFRLGENLKSRIEEAAAQAGLSVNAWLGRAATAALANGDRATKGTTRTSWGGQRYTGWVR